MPGPSNPINDERKAEIQRITERVLEAWTKAYLSAYKDVMMEEAEARLAEGTAVPEVDPEEGDPPERPRGDQEEPPQQVVSTIVSSETFDYDVDPYISYVVKSSLGDEEAQVFRRYNEFKVLHKKVGKKVKGAKLPPANSKFGKRNLDWEFVRERRKALKEYLDTLCEDEKAKEDKEFHHWLGLGLEEDPIDKKTFDLAFQRAKWRLWIWKKIAADDQGERIAKLVIEEIKREMFYDIRAELHELPEKVKKMSMQLAYKSITAIVNPAVKAGWEATKKALEEVKPKINEVVAEAMDKVVEVKAQLKAKIKEVMQAAMQPLMDELLPVIDELVNGFASPLGEAVKPFLEKYRGEWKEKYLAVLKADKWEEDLFKELKKDVKETRKDIEKTVEEKMQEAAEKVLGDLKSKITVDALASVFSPFESVHEIFKNVFKMMSPKNHERPLEVFMKHKAELLEAGGAEAPKVNEILDKEERDVMWRRWWSSYTVRRKGYKIYWEIWSLLDNWAIAHAWYEFSRELVSLNDRMVKKFAWKFGDFLNDAVQTPIADGEAYKAKVNECIDSAWDRATGLVMRELGMHAKRLLKEFFMSAVVGDIVKHVEPLLQEGVEPLQELIIAPADQILDLQVMVGDSFNEVISENLDKVVETCSGAIVTAFS